MHNIIHSLAALAGYFDPLINDELLPSPKSGSHKFSRIRPTTAGLLKLNAKILIDYEMLQINS
jgi:hypothetical protein